MIHIRQQMTSLDFNIGYYNVEKSTFSIRFSYRFKLPKTAPNNQ